jgi:hypothetical protein
VSLPAVPIPSGRCWFCLCPLIARCAAHLTAAIPSCNRLLLQSFA